MSASRSSGDSGPRGLAPSDVLSWSTLTGSMITPAEYSVLSIMDAAYIDAMYRHREEQRARYKAGQKEAGK